MTENYRSNVRFMDVCQHALNRGLQNWTREGSNKVGREAFEGMYEYIFESVMDLFSQASFNISEDAKKWMVQKLYLSIRFRTQGQVALPDGSELQAPAKVFEEVDIKEIRDSDLRMLGSLLSDCDFAVEIAQELRRRS